jgi:hypothetical protein
MHLHCLDRALGSVLPSQRQRQTLSAFRAWLACSNSTASTAQLPASESDDTRVVEDLDRARASETPLFSGTLLRSEAPR